MKDSRHFMPEVCPETSETVQTVSLEVDPNHPLLQLKRALPWDALCQVRTFHWRQAGKNVDGGPGLSWEVSFYGHLVVLMLVKQLNAREMEAYLAENVVARVFIGRSVAPSPQMRDHANIARAYMALGQEGLDAVGALIIKSATGLGFADPTILSSDMTAQELPIGYPNGRCFKAVDLIFSLSGCDIHMTEGSDDYPSAPLPLLPRNRHRPTWQIA